MSDFVCEQLTGAIEALKLAIKSNDREEITLLVQSVADALTSLYSPLKDEYYGGLICKELYVEVRTARECVIDLLLGSSGQETQCGCPRDSSGILALLQDVGGENGCSECCDDSSNNLEEVYSLLQEVLCQVTRIRALVCDPCEYDACNTSSESCGSAASSCGDCSSSVSCGSFSGCSSGSSSSGSSSDSSSGSSSGSSGSSSDSSGSSSSSGSCSSCDSSSSSSSSSSCVSCRG